jgi:hypothetical protein
MAGKVFISVSMSLDGFIAPESPKDLMGPKWMELQHWIFPLRSRRLRSWRTSSATTSARTCRSIARSVRPAAWDS